MGTNPLKPSDVQVLPDPARRWLPATPSQKAALDSPADILLLGGAAGSLKTSTILVDLIQERESPKMRSYFFRRMYTELEGGDGAIDQSHHIFPQTGAVYNSTTHTWRWPSGAEFYFRHCKTDKDVFKYQGHAMSAIGIDESTHWMMKLIRYLITRNRSTDPWLKIRTRLGTNPGNVGHKEHMKLFFPDIRTFPKEIVGVCPHCDPQFAPPQGELRFDAKWPDDGTPLSDPNGDAVSVAYILSYVRDHNLLGSRYIANLKMQNPATAKALLEGCWKVFEGQYYDCWDSTRMTVPIQSIPVEWWWPHWTGTDYGYSGSAAASGLFTRSPSGVIYLLNEYPTGDRQGARREDARKFARNHYDNLLRYGRGADRDSGYEQPMRLDAMYLGRDSWAERGADHSLAALMNEELTPQDLEFIPVSDDRAGGAQLTYTKLANDEFKVARNCRNTVESLESRLHDEKEPMKVRKDPGSHLCDYHDMVLHGLYGYLDTERKPSAERIKERLKAIVDTGDPMALTSAMISYQKIVKAEEAEENEDPVYVGGSARRRMNRATDKHT